ncbi:MAG: class I SAM-dependent methyltransferase [Bacteroidia bacterium]
MKKWILKAIVQKTISFLPFKHRINFLFQKYVTKGLFLTDIYFEDRLIHASNHLKGYQKLSGKNIPAKALELGTGWYPVVPITLFLCGADEIHSIDVAELTNKDFLITTLVKYVHYLNNPSKKKLFTGLPLINIRIKILNELLTKKDSTSLNEMLSSLNLKYKVTDATKTDYPSGYFDLVNSNNTFEHIYPEVLEKILLEFKRITKPIGGVMSHFIDLSDHFAHFDKTITIYNFLKFSDSKWKWINNSIQPMNRLRINDYLEIYRKLNIPVTQIQNRKFNIEEVKAVDVAEKYKRYSLEDLAVSHSYVFSKF